MSDQKSPLASTSEFRRDDSARACDDYCADMVMRWHRGEQIPAEAYLHRHAVLQNEGLAFEIILTELVLRQERGHGSTIDEFVFRFPEFNDRLRRHFALHAALANSPNHRGNSTAFMRKGGVESATTTRPNAPILLVPGYEILGELGAGAMGIVYRARQINLNRQVALKMIQAGRVGDNERTRLQIEAEALSRLQHPNIVQIHDISAYEGKPFLVFELVDGGNLAERLRMERPSVRSAAALVETLANAMQYAHQQGIVHRDLKPANVLLGPIAEATSDPARETDWPTIVKIADFGLAKLLDGAIDPTLSGDVIGTPAYMAPEQASPRRHLVGVSSDVYALGAILYELLTGRPPFCAESPWATLLQVIHEDPIPPRRLQPDLPRDLESICLKCLEKEPRRRYPTATALAEDLGRFRRGESVIARPPTQIDRIRRWAVRHPVATSLALVTTLATATIVATLSAANVRIGGLLTSERQARADLNITLNREQQQLYLERVTLAHRMWSSGQILQAEQLLDLCPAHLRQWEWRYLNSLRGANLHTLHGHSQFVTCVTYSSKGRLLASSDHSGTIIVWDAAHAEKQSSFRPFKGPVVDLAFSPDETRLAVAGVGVRIHDVATGAEIHSLNGGNWVAHSRDGRQIATSTDSDVLIYDASTGRLTHTFKGHQNTVWSGDFSPDGKHLATGSQDKRVRIWTLDGGNSIELPPTRPNEEIVSVRYSADGNSLHVGHFTSMVTLDVKTGRPRAELPFIGASPSSIALSSDRKWMARLLDNYSIEMRPVSGAPERRRFVGHSLRMTSIAFDPSRDRLASAAGDRTVRIWDLERGRMVRVVEPFAPAAGGLAFNFDSTQVAVGGSRYDRLTGSDSYVGVYDSAAERQFFRCQGANGVAFSPDGKRIAAGGGEGVVTVSDAATGTSLFEIAGHAGSSSVVGFSPDGERLVTASRDTTVRVWQVGEQRQVAKIEGAADWVNCVALSPDGREVAMLERDENLACFDAANGNLLRRFKAPHLIRSICFSPDSRFLATSGRDRMLMILDANSGEVVQTFHGHTEVVWSVAFSPDGRRLVSGSADATVRVWDVKSGRELISLPNVDDRVTRVTFSPDGRRIAALCPGLKIWDSEY